jgi:hypothetical protein
MRLRTYKLLAALAPLLVGLFADVPVAQGQTLQIDLSTASWIEGFADFVRWEGEGSAETLTIGVVGAPEIANYLLRRAAERTSKPLIQVAKISPNDSFEGIDIVYVGGSHREHWDKVFDKCITHGILSMSSQEGFVEAGGGVEFVVRRNRLRFHIADDNAQACGVVISSKLLELAIEPKP